MIRVLHIVTYMGRGGIETMLMNYYRHVDREKMQFDFLVHRDFEADYDREIRELGGRIYHISRLVPWSRSYKRKLKKFFGEHPEYRIIHVHQDCLSSVALKCAKECGIPVRIAHSHAASQDRNIKYLFKLYYKRLIPRYATYLYACGKDAGDWMFGGTDYSILNNAIPAREYIYNSEKRECVRSELGLEDSFTVGMTGRFCHQKNHDFLLKIFAALIRLEPNARLLFVGDGELRPEIEKKIRKLGLEKQVILTGVRTDVPDILQAMDAFVIPSNYEGLSLASIEAQAAGLPCFISDKVSIECRKTDLVEQIALSRSPEYWARRILTAKGRVRRNTYSEIVKAGFDIEDNAKKLQEFYLEKAGEIDGFADGFYTNLQPCTYTAADL